MTEIRTTIRIEEALYKELRKKLIDEGLSFQDWTDKVIRKYLNLPPKWSYGKSESSETN